MRHFYRKFKHYRAALGWNGAVFFVIAKLTGRKPLYKTSLPGLPYPVYVRLATTDTSVFLQTLVEKHYDIPAAVSPALIIDAGANIGLSAIFFANKYPHAKIVALEPESSNFELLKRNAARYPQIDCRQVALWKEETILQLSDPGNGNHAFQTVERSPNDKSKEGTPAVTVSTILNQLQPKGPVFLKIDIEGAEREVFESCQAWIARVALIFAELHESLKPGCEQAFHRATQEFPSSYSKGETVVRARSQSPLPESLPTLPHIC